MLAQPIGDVLAGQPRVWQWLISTLERHLSLARGQPLLEHKSISLQEEEEEEKEGRPLTGHY